jgi:hypothetical protein
MMLSIPLRLIPNGRVFERPKLEWSRYPIGRHSLDVLAALRRLTEFNVEIAPGTNASRLRERLDAMLDNPGVLPPGPAFQLVPDYFEAIRRTGLASGDMERLRRLLADERVTPFWFFPYDALKAPEATKMFLDPILDRLPQAAQDENGETFKSLEALVRSLPGGSFSKPDPRVEALLANPDTRYRSPNLILRLTDQGSSAAGRLVELVRDSWTLKQKGVANLGSRRESTSVVAALRALCMLGGDASAVLPELRQLATTGIVPAHFLENNLWRVTMVRLGADVTEFDKPAKTTGTLDQYQTLLLQNASDRRCEL